MAGFVSLASYPPPRGKLFDPDPADSIEKVFCRRDKIFKSPDAFNAVRHGGPRRLEQKFSATFFFARRTHPHKKSSAGKPLREFCLGSIFDFFNRIGQ
jgi:hypothetical protein